jgi:crotonobetainyl-CoA:carnitine CoA-transferase CaiB-like acyl-CoA transferase
VNDARFAEPATRAGHRKELEAILEPWFRARSAADVFALLDDRGVPCEIADGDFCRRVHDDPEMRAHGLVVTQQHPKLGRFDHFGTTIHFSDTPSRIWGPPPLCGQHSREILDENGFGSDEIDALIASGAVFEELWVD